jgi:uncharacterized protein (DUF433 family)
MSTPSAKRWKYLAPDPKSSYRQLFVKGRRIRAMTLYDATRYHDQPMTPEEVAADYDLPLEAVQEAIAYCESNPPEIEEDFQREEARVRAAGKDRPPFPQQRRSDLPGDDARNEPA